MKTKRTVKTNSMNIETVCRIVPARSSNYHKISEIGLKLKSTLIIINLSRTAGVIQICLQTTGMSQRCFPRSW